jgi:Bacterial protein of unknown function (DUF839)
VHEAQSTPDKTAPDSVESTLETLPESTVQSIPAGDFGSDHYHQIMGMAPPLDPTEVPSNSPSSYPSLVVGFTVAWIPFGNDPIPAPSNDPSNVAESLEPSRTPSKFPTRKPTRAPTDAPSMDEFEEYPELPRPTVSINPTTRAPSPTFLPTQEPSQKISHNPTARDSELTRMPTIDSDEIEFSATSPSDNPTFNPSQPLSGYQTNSLTEATTGYPTWTPTGNPTGTPTTSPTSNPTLIPSSAPTVPSSAPTDELLPTDFIPGLLTVEEAGLLLSHGLTARLLARGGEPVPYDKVIGSETESEDVFHTWPDAGAVFDDPSPSNPGGWIYVSNSEDESEGGVGALTFDRDGNVIKYKLLLTGTLWNCGGGKTPWNTWVSCEELGNEGRIYQVDPTGAKEPEMLTMGQEGGYWESFAHDVRNPDKPRFFVTEDDSQGALQRFTPNSTDWSSFDAMWSMLHGPGVIDYLLLSPDPNDASKGTFSWGADKKEAQKNAKKYYPNTEGIDFHDGILFFVCKGIKMLFELDLDTMQYTRHSTQSGVFDGEPDQLKRILTTGGEELLFFTEDGGELAGIHARDETGLFFTILESEEYSDETTGLALSPDFRRLYVAYQDNGLVFEVSRRDGQPLNARSLDVKYHAA